MHIDKLELTVATQGAEEAAQSFHRLAEAIGAASQALEEFAQKHPNLDVAICGSLVSVKVRGAVEPQQLADMIRDYDRNGVVG